MSLELLQYYAMERFLYRLSLSRYADRFILKGGLMLRIWHLPEHRPTMDIDMLGRSSNQESEIVAQIREVLVVDVEPDGLSFKPDSIQTERITQDADYEGLRIRFLCFLDNAKINMQIDIGFGDVVYPAPKKMDFPVMLNSSIPRLLCYSLESSIAEKLEAMVKLGVQSAEKKRSRNLQNIHPKKGATEVLPDKLIPA
jgi:predicted nucleotidyltransferase component of viral defense system